MHSNSIFQAAWPKSLVPVYKPFITKALGWALKTVFFPFYLVYLGLQKLGNWCVHPASHPFYEDDHELIQKCKNWVEVKQFYETEFPGTKVQSCTFKTPDGITLDGTFVRSTSSHPYAKKALIYLGGSGDSYENRIDEFLSFIKSCVDEHVAVLFINSRGVGLSKGLSSPDKLPLDIYSAYEYLIHEHHFNPNDIGLYGFSLGGGIGTIGAALIQEKYPDAKIGVINERSFSSIASVVQHWCGNGKFGRFAVKVIQGLDLDIPVVAAWKALKGHKVLYCDARDRIVPFEASLYSAVNVGLRVQIGSPTDERSHHVHWHDWWNHETLHLDIAENIRKMLSIPLSPRELCSSQ